MSKNKLSQLLADAPADGQPVIRRGQGMTLSTENGSPEAAHEVEHNQRTIAQMRKCENALNPPQRINRGYRLREDLVRACKATAARQGKRLYQVMEEAMRLYLAENMAVRQLEPERQQPLETDKLYYLLEGRGQAIVTHQNGSQESLQLKRGTVLYGDDYQAGHLEASGSNPLTLLMGELS